MTEWFSAKKCDWFLARVAVGRSVFVCERLGREYDHQMEVAAVDRRQLMAAMKEKGQGASYRIFFVEGGMLVEL